MIQARPRKLTFLFLFISLSFNLFAQVNKSAFKGTVVDETALPVPGATLMILNAQDSTLVLFGSSNADGGFIIRNVPAGSYLLNISFLGLEPAFIPITSGEQPEMNLDTIKLITANTVLSEVQIKADFVPVEVHKDTISYNADAFQVQPNAAVEDLLKKLPGIEVAPDGTIKAQGEDVQNILVDGKEFFGADGKIATKNLPAKALKKIKVYDKQSDVAEFTGIDDGEREKTIDLQLRDEFKKGLFGSAQAGYGTDQKYNLKASINKFTKTNQLAVLGQLNNINDQGFSFSDRMSFGGGMRSMMGGGGWNEFSMSSSIPSSDGGSQNGLVNTGAGGVNFTFQKNKNFNIRSSYFYNNVDKDLEKYSYRQNLSENPFDTEEISNSNTVNATHSFAFNSDIVPDTSQQVKVNARFSFGDGSFLGDSYVENFVTGDTLENRSVTNEDNASDNLSLNANATYMKRLNARGRNVTIGGTVNKSDQDSDNQLEALTEYFTSGSTDALDQLQYSISDQLRLEGQFTFTEYLRKRRFLEINYSYSNQESDYDKAVSDLVNSEPVENPILSNDYASVFQYHRTGASFRYSGEIHNINAGLQYQISELNGQVNLQEEDIKRTYYNFLPRFFWRADLGNGKGLRFNYNTRVNAPSITQLSPVIDNSDPLRLYVGNPNLDAELSHNLNIHFNSFSQFSSVSIFASLSSTITKNKIITSRYVDDQFREVSTPLNIDDETSYRANLSFGRPLKFLHSRFNINLNGGLTKTQNLIASELLDLNRWSRSGGISFTNLNSKVLEYNVGGQWTFNDNYYQSNESLNQNTLLHTYSLDVTVHFWKKWSITGNFDYNLYTSDQFAENQGLPLMELAISRYVFPGDKGQFKFSIFDVLDENRGISQSVNTDYIEEVRTNSIGKYAMLSFIYSIRGPGGEAKGGFNYMERRR